MFRFVPSMLGSLLLAPACALALVAFPDATPQLFLGGQENFDLVMESKIIKVFRALGAENKTKPGKVITIDGQKCDVTPVIVNGPKVEKVALALSDMGNFGEMFMCIFNPGVILRFEAGKKILDIMICFHCQEMILFKDGVLVRRPLKWASTKNTFSKDARRAFTAIAKAAFPKDSEIQKLKE